MGDLSSLTYDFLTRFFILFVYLGDMAGLASGFQDPICMVDGSAYDPDKAYKDSKLVSNKFD